MFAPRGRGYDSSDSEDEAPKRPALGGAPGQNQDEKKKKKIKLPPQESINKIWERFSKNQFSKALTVLPFEPVPASTSSERANELLSAGYERAAEECRRRVRKIIQECKRVNTRYRDPGFDLDWDLKWEKGNCLNYLGKVKFHLSTSNMRDPSSSIPKAVKRVHEIFEKPTFMKNVSCSDVKQGGLGDCWLMASLSGLANVEDAIRRSCVEYDTRIGIYGFVFYRDGEWIYSIIDDKLYLKSPCWDDRSMQRDLLQQIDREEAESVYRKTYQTGSKALFFAQNKDQNETWVPLIEKAYAKAHGDYASLDGGWIGEGVEDLSGGVTTELLSSDILDTDAFWEDELSKVNTEFLFGCSTGLLDGGHGQRDGIQERHAYNVVETRTLKDGTRLLKLRNPWASKKGIWEGPYSDGSKEWNKNVQEELGHSFGSDSVFWITYDDLLRKFQHIDRTRLFREADWRCCQRWIGVDVPWRPQYNKKFHIKLTKDSPLVLVLSQLDVRYFKGLQGQYMFELHFRVHEQSRPDPEDYIVRSHGNYLMVRSVGVELPSMPAGNYSIWISITAERRTGSPSVEDVVKRECKRRVENEKLAQVGRAYDLAHSKAAAHLAEVARQRKSTEQTKASDERKRERRKVWLKRHIQKDIQKAQAAKNVEKKARRRAERNAAAKKEAEEEAAAKKEAEEEAAKKVLEEKAAAKKEQEGKASAEPAAGKGEEEKASGVNKEQEEQPSNPKSEGAPRNEADKEQEDTEAEKPKLEGEAAGDTKGQTAQANDASTSGEKVKTEEQKPVETKLATDPEAAVQEKTETGSTSSTSTSTPQHTPLVTPKSESGHATPVEDESKEKVSVPPVDGGDSVTDGPPPPDRLPVICQYHKEQEERAQQQLLAQQAAQQAARQIQLQQQRQQQQNMQESSDDSSDSPVSDWEVLYSSDDQGKKAAAPNEPDDDETEDETRPDPWNAICVVGFRVYSKDENLELRVVMEGGDLEEGGMGEKGEHDLDNAQANAGGEREKKREDKKDAADDKTAERKGKGDDADKDGNKDDGKETQKDNKGKEDAEKDKAGKETDGDPAGSDNTEGFATYPIIVSKGGKEFEKASLPVVNDEKNKVDDEQKKTGDDSEKAEQPKPPLEEKPALPEEEKGKGNAGA